MAITGFPQSFKEIGQGAIFDKLYFTIIIAVVLGVIFHIILTKSKFGRRLIAAGGNSETAYLAGINVTRIKMGMHVLVSVFAALAGVLMASRFASALPAVGSGTELTIMASVIIGGTSTFGGSGSIWGNSDRMSAPGSYHEWAGPYESLKLLAESDIWNNSFTFDRIG